jgi:hypothetical protein
VSTRLVKPKRKCCGSDPRCKRCPTVLKRLRKAGYAERRADGIYVVAGKVPKKRRRAARKR